MSSLMSSLMSILNYSKVSIAEKRGNMYLKIDLYRVYEHEFLNEPQIQTSYYPFGLFSAVKCQIEYVLCDIINVTFM